MEQKKFPISHKRRKVSDSTNDDFKHPGNAKHPKFDHKRDVHTSNSFEVLTTEDEHMEVDNGQPITHPQMKVNPKRIPPIVLHGKIEDHQTFTKNLKDLCKGKYFIKYREYTTNIFMDNMEDYNKVLDAFKKEDDVDCHTFTTKEQKTHAFVLYGLENKPETREIAEDLLTNSIPVQKVFLMNGTKQPCYMVVTNNKVTLRKLQKDIKVLLYTRIRWGRVHKKREIIMCHRCQSHGHATANCYSKPVCLKCAENHLTKDCLKPKDTPARCYNCNKDHPANYLKCEAYLNLLEKRKLRREPLKQKSLPPAPLPTHNVWEERMKMREKNRTPLEGETQRSNEETGKNIFNDLKNEFNKLNEYIDINKCLLSIRQLNQKLALSRNPSERFNLFNCFISNLENHGF